LTGGEGHAKARRLRRAEELGHATRSGTRRRLGFLDVSWLDNSAGHPRLGLIVPKFRASAVARNRLRRRLREIWRREIGPELPAWDVVIRARPAAYTATFAAIRAALHGWRQREVP